MRKLNVDELNRLEVEEYKQAEKRPVVLVLDNIRSLYNVGAAFRTADAFCIEKVYLCGITGTPPHREIRKTAIGASEAVDWEYRESVADLVKELRTEGWRVMAVEQTDESIDLRKFNPEKNEKYAFIFSHETFGITEELLPEIHGCLEIPQYGTKHSLNVSVSIGVVLWDYFSKTASLT